ncbi:gephyrin-like molybdotransferase Glp [Chloroflexota bacterium]
MISVEEALEKILSHVEVLETEEKPILDGLGQVLAEDIHSSIQVPPLDNSAMDGYAVQWESIRQASNVTPRVLKVIGEVAAGSMAEKAVEPGTAIRIMTGAPVPQGADTVVPFEDTDEIARKEKGMVQGDSWEISVVHSIPRGDNIRLAGEDITQGSLVLKRGTELRPAETGVLAALGYTKVLVNRRPVVAVLATGDELVDIGKPLPPGKLYNSNSYSIAALILRYGGIPQVLGIARDNVESLVEKIEQGLNCDMLITTAGVSMGDYDIVKDVLAKQGEITFWTVRMKPGKPLVFGVLKGREGKKFPQLGLPGTPGSAMVSFEQFGRPAILKMLGKKKLKKPTVQAIIEGEVVNQDGRRIYAWAEVRKSNGRYCAKLTGSQGSGILTSMSQANGLVIIPEDVPLVTKGNVVQVQMFDWSEEQD